MRYMSIIAASVLLVHSVPAQQSGRDVVRGLQWLAGCWERQAGTRLVEEAWLAPRAGTMLGLGRTTRGDTLVEFEQLRIFARGDTLVYAAAPSGQPRAEFRAVPPLDPHDLIFANPVHDFPQRIRYRRVGPDSLVARIEGERNGVPRGVDFPFRRVSCARAMGPASP